jgi:excisionase family DNA binding protein
VASRNELTGQDVHPGWITAPEAARRLGVTDRRVRQLIDEGKLIGYRVGTRQLLVKESSIEEYLREQ